MFKSKTRTQLEAGIRYMIREVSPKKHSSDDILHAINDVAIDLWADLSLMAGPDWCQVETTPVDIVAGTEVYDGQGIRFYGAVQVWDGSNWENLNKITAEQWARELDPGYILPAYPSSLPEAYKLMADTVILRPTPQTGIPSGLRFIGRLEFTDMAGANDTSGMPHVLDPVIECLAAALLLLQEGNSAATAWEARGQARKGKALERLFVRDGEPRTMNTESEADWDDSLA